MIGLKDIFTKIVKFKNFWKQKHQKHFYLIEEFKEKIKTKNQEIYNFNNYFISSEDKIRKGSYRRNIKRISKIILRVTSKYEKIFNYFLDGKQFSRKITPKNLNFLKIDVNKKSNFSFNSENKFYIFKPIFLNKKSKKKLVLILLLDGFGRDLANNAKNSINFFGKNNFFNNVWSNSNWTLPSFGNLITGKYVPNHTCFEPETFYNNSSQISYKSKMTLFESFSKQDFVTGCYSPYLRVNPTYGSSRGVDFFKFCSGQTADEMVENIIAQLNLFKDSSNFIFAHFFDSHGPQKKHVRLSEASYFPEKNYDFKKDNNEKLSRALNTVYGHDEVETLSLFKFLDSKLLTLYNFLKSQNYDDYTIILLGDHGTRVHSMIKNKDLLANNMANISFFIKDKKNKFSKIKREKTIHMVDVYPSLLSRYSKKLYNKLLKDVDGKNTIFSSTSRKFNLTESAYKEKYDLHVRKKNYQLYSSFNFNNKKVGNIISKKFLNSKEKIINRNNSNKEKFEELQKITDDHMKKNNFK